MEKKQSNRSTEVLAILQQAGEDFVSGEQLCQKLGVSRTAVWKIIKKLKEDGYDIEGVSNRGYRLKEEPEILSREAILTRFHGSWSCAQVECYPVIGSTNDRAKEAYVEGAPHGTLVVADCQKAGKGRRGRQWETPAGAAIAMSSLLRPQLPPEKASMLTLVMALALAQGVLDGCGAWRVHGGGFGGTTQNFVPLDKLEEFRTVLESVFGAGSCHVLSIRPCGGVCVDRL